ncbi:hypothetical protein V5740_01940 [Croceibacterium sp. TMG7-5b_MA50]|uniref:hypothetical protein n=1 Tax=Croceibacterium sp. TMG7-5b_MA50 TaxID=3121290 RepID=UPI00322197C0
MSFWTAIVVLALIWGITSVLRVRHHERLGFATDEDGNPIPAPDRERAAELQREVAELRERVRVLERIATDDTHGRRLSDQIDRLRDE